MIKLEHLCKYYKGKVVVKALDDVSITLPDKGMVFVIGKSGSGKSTFLNVVGGLDDITSGLIEINGIDITKFSSKELDNYRNNYTGIIYQNFNLFQNETVYQNIMAAALISNKNVAESEINSIFEKLELSTSKNKLVKNMSGGQRQRVAIARALIKNPDMILADEPTGNLDSKTATAIFDILADISKEKLVIVISHDTQSAEKYADRIIQLADGHVISDKIKNETIDLDENAITISKNNNISDEKLNEINEILSQKDIRIVREKEKYIDYKNDEVFLPNNKDILEGKNKIKASFVLSYKFFKSSWISFIVTALIIASILVILSFSQVFIGFDGHDTIAKVAKENETKAYVMNKAYSETDDTTDLVRSYAVETVDKDIETFKKAGYEGNIYEIYNAPLSITLADEQNGKIPWSTIVYSSFYSSTGLGVVVCDNNYLNKAFGDIEVLAGSLKGLENSHKIIVTDYFADSIIEQKKASTSSSIVSDDSNDPYQKIVNTKLFNKYTIGAIIKTGYKEKYADLINMFNEAANASTNARELLKLIYYSKSFSAFINEANSILNFAYSINPNFKQTLINSDLNTASGISAVIANDSGNYVIKKEAQYVKQIDSLNDNEIMLSLDAFNSIFNTDYIANKVFDVNEVYYVNLSTFTVYQDILTSKPKHTLRLKVVGIFDSTNISSYFYAYVSKSTLNIYLNDSIVPFALLFDNVDLLYDITQTGQANYFYTNMIMFSPLVDIFNIIEVFSDFFMLIIIILIVVAFLVIVMQNLKVMRKNQYRIGVYRAIGYSNISIFIASFLNIVYLILSILSITIILVYSFENLVNSLLIDGFIKYMHSTMIEGYTIINVSLDVIMIYLGVGLALGFLSIAVPLLYIRKLKPNLIINKAD